MNIRIPQVFTLIHSATSSTEGISERGSSTGVSWQQSATTPNSSQEHTDRQHADNHKKFFLFVGFATRKF